MTQALAIDLSCLALGPLAASPRGIDRVELAYARHFLGTWPGEAFALLPTIWGVRLFERERALVGIAALEDIWNENIRLEDDLVYRELRIRMGADDAVGIPKSAKARRQAGSSLSRFTRLLASTGFAFGRPAAQVLPPHSIYLNVGQLLFFKPTVAWLAQRPDITSVVMLHDVIPIEHPTHHVKLGVHLHRAIVRNAIAFSDGLIVPTHFVRDSLVRVDRRFGELPIHVERLPVTAAFLARQKPDEDLQRVGYYLACGAIEAHKNHVVLLQAWKKWMEVDNAGVPRLIIAGKLSPTSEVVLDFLAKNPALERKVSVVSDLSTPAIRALMANAKAVLMPSIAEGFGLPIVEALAQGTMVVASDTPAHREAGESGLVIYTSPTDFQSWFTAIQSVEQNCGRSAGALSKRPYVAKTWETYFRSIEAFLDSTVAAKSKETTLIDSTLSRSASS